MAALVSNLHLDPAGLGVLEGVPQQFQGDPVKLVLEQWLQILPLPFQRKAEDRWIPLRLLGVRQILAGSSRAYSYLVTYHRIIAEIDQPGTKPVLKPLVKVSEVRSTGQAEGTRYRPSSCSSKISLGYSLIYPRASFSVFVLWKQVDRWLSPQIVQAYNHFV